jgi:cell division septation protein DedD
MKRKIFARKQSTGFRSYLKFLLWAAIGLVVLVLFIPLTSRQKAGKEALKKPASERGMVVREIPKSLQPAAESPEAGKAAPAEVPKAAESKPAVTPEAKGSGAVNAGNQPVAVKEKPAETPPATLKKPEAAEVAAKETQTATIKTPEPVPAPIAEPKPKAVEPVPVPDKPVKPAPAPTTNVPAAVPSATVRDVQKPAAPEGRKLYAVQVASLKDKNAAEDLKKTLQKKGFDAVIKITGEPKQGQTYVLQLQPVDNMGKASTLLEQVKYVPQTKPSIITVPAGN